MHLQPGGLAWLPGLSSFVGARRCTFGCGFLGTYVARAACAMAPGAELAMSQTANPTPLEGRLVLAACGKGKERGIGMAGALPWPRLRDDLSRFAAITRSAAVVMGRATYESLPDTARPLPGRVNVVLSRKSRGELKLPDSVLLAGSLDAAEHLLRARNVPMPLYVIGGADIFSAALARPQWSQRIYYTDVQADFQCDRMFEYDLDAPDSMFDLVSVSEQLCNKDVPFVFKEYVRKDSFKDLHTDEAAGTRPGFPSAAVPTEGFPRGLSASHQELQYLSLIKRVLANGVSRGDRTGTGTRALFGETMRFDLRDSFPLLTTKRVFWRGVAEELLWFVSGSTNANLLSEKGIHIWDGNGSREFLDKRGFPDREVGDLGPVYGFQWRHFGAKYVDMHQDYRGQGVDQLSDVIETIKNRPTDRRIIMSAWNPAAMDEMALPPCHMMAQFFVADGELSCMMYQRSCDIGLGVPFNIASYALLTRMIAHITGLAPGDFVHVLGDAHIYNNHIEALTEQVARTPRAFPQLKIRDRADLVSIDDFTMDDFEIVGYNPHKKLSMTMAV